MKETTQRQISLGYAFALTAVAAVGVTAFLKFQEQIGTGIALGYSVWVGLMGFLCAQILFRFRARPIWRTATGTIVFALGVIPICSPSTVLPDYDLRVLSFANNITINEELDRIIASIDDPEAVLAASRELHRSLMKLPESERRINGDSDLIPPVLSRIKPQSIYTNKNVLQLQIFRNYEKSYGLYAYPKSYTSKQVGTRKIIDGLWWLEF